ncbi:sugar phosphate isomerase/epimerase [Candidatus Pelagibacter sp.]|nr:sugar phosphate isomerase/epimerase [Candidatus Pelagibacter sp.]
MILKNNTGIMQGRLLPKYQGKYQAHPVDYWQEEFKIANQLNLDCIEFILDYYKSEKNPLLNSDGLEEIKKIVKASGVKVLSICADYFMLAPIHSDNFAIVDRSLAILNNLIKNASQINASEIVVPCVDQSSLKNKRDIDVFVKNIKSIVKTAETSRINICLETDLNPKDFANMLDSIGSENVTVNYDIGNSAALGYDPIEEFKAYGDKITDLHIKDRLLGGKSVPLGKGNVNFSKIFDLLSKYDYQGIIIFQAFRDDEGVKVFKDQLSWFLQHFK